MANNEYDNKEEKNQGQSKQQPNMIIFKLLMILSLTFFAASLFLRFWVDFDYHMIFSIIAVIIGLASVGVYVYLKKKNK